MVSNGAILCPWSASTFIKLLHGRAKMLHHVICLWMVQGDFNLLDSCQFTELAHDPGDKVDSVIHQYFFGYA